MAEPKWTPGPWSYFRDDCAQCDREGVAEFVIVEPPGGHHGQFSNEADARLIAAAPDLYAALVAQDEAQKSHSLCECRHHPEKYLASMCLDCVARYMRADALRKAALARADGSEREEGP